MSTGVVFTEDFKKHDPGKGHPESSARMDAVSRALATPQIADRLVRVAPRPAEKEHILLIHWERLYDEVMATQAHDRSFLDEDTVASRQTAELAHLSAGAVLTAVEGVMEGRLGNAFAFSRPPGHHAKPDKAMGFCFFNNVAVGAKYAQQRYLAKRVLIIDFDVHHGNGTQKAFYTSPEVLYVSIHQSPHYPGTGAVTETGRDAGDGFTLNVPLAAGSGDADYLSVFRDIVVPVGIEFAPELVLVSAGFDAHRDDPLGGMKLSREGYAAISEEIVRLAHATCGGKVVFVLEGGYDLEALEESIVAVLRVLTGEKASRAIDTNGAVREVIEEVRRVHGSNWSCLRTS
ncbi:MAG TPA: histone deacetylase [Vicinamibacteria bacterium]|nr:histone deacetylase [Vicinamibacteria bacterium]